ncbi:MAG: hypothetical protein WB870_10160 [Gallionellaceae bacterium]
MPNEEQAALSFFSQPENLPLALITAEHLDGIRLRLNNEFWIALRSRIDSFLAKRALKWDSNLTEDRNNAECLVGLHLQPQSEQRVFLRPFMEQQFMGDCYRVYHGLMWSTAPGAAQKTLPAVEALGLALQTAGFKQSDSFLAWQWLPWHPRQRDFLLRFANQRDRLMDEADSIWSRLLVTFGEELRLANLALDETRRNVTVSLDHLRSQLKT